MSTTEVNDWRYPSVPQAVCEALKNYPEMIAEIEGWLGKERYAMSSSLSFDERVDRLFRVTESIEDGISYFAQRNINKLRVASVDENDDKLTLILAKNEQEAIAAAKDAFWTKAWDELEAFYGLRRDESRVLKFVGEE